jgi:CheY-like chemotaxis protein
MVRVLVVDDCTEQQELYLLILSTAGYEVLSALDGRRGLALVRELRPDVVLLDMMMPEIDGLEFLARLAAEPRRPPVIANSGFDGLRDEALRRGACAFLVKPISPDTLLGTLESVIARCPVDEELLAENQAGAARARQRALDDSRRAVDRLDVVGCAILKEGLRRVVCWLPGYFGFGMAVVHLLRAGELWIEALHNGPARLYEGKSYPRDIVYCDDVIAAGSTLVLPDPLHHPCEHFAHHSEIERGWRFYAGVPLTISSRCVIGTLCMMHTEARDFHSEDMRVLEALGSSAAQALEAHAEGRAPVWPLDDAWVFSRHWLDLFVDVVLARAVREGGAAAVRTSDADDGHAHCLTGVSTVQLRPDRLAMLWGGSKMAGPPTGAWVEVGDRTQLLAGLA